LLALKAAEGKRGRRWLFRPAGRKAKPVEKSGVITDDVETVIYYYYYSIAYFGGKVKPLGSFFEKSAPFCYY